MKALILMLLSFSAQALTLQSPDGSTVQEALIPPKNFQLGHWYYVCIETEPPTPVYLCRWFDVREFK